MLALVRTEQVSGLPEEDYHHSLPCHRGIFIVTAVPRSAATQTSITCIV